MRFLFWNVGGTLVAPLIASAVHENDIDVIVLAESVDPIISLSVAVNTNRSRKYIVPRGIPADVRRSLLILARLPLHSLLPVRDADGLSALQIQPPVGPRFTLIALHLRSKLHQDPEDQTLAAVETRHAIENIEAHVGHRRTVIVGDLNMNPFERGVAASDALHGVMSRQIAERGQRIVARVPKTFFYNPMWNHFGDHRPNPPGTYYRDTATRTNYFWNIFDQVLVRPALLPFFPDDGVRILTSIGGTSLLSDRGVPDRAAGSDHLPLLFTLEIERGHDDGVKEPVGGDQVAG